MVLLDTNIFDAYLKYSMHRWRGDHEKASRVESAYQQVDALEQIVLSALTVWELERWLIKKGARRQLEAFYSTVALCQVVPVSPNVLSAASHVWADVRRANLDLEDVDTLILATARVWGATLITADGKLRRSAGVLSPPVATQNWMG